jgi:hypothetical protein
LSITSKKINTEYKGHGVCCTITCAEALLLQQGHSLPSSALYSSLQNIIAYQAYVLKRFMKKKYFEKERKTERYWPKLSEKGLVHVKNRTHVNGIIPNNFVFTRRF